jgi:hypothetical protein
LVIGQTAQGDVEVDLGTEDVRVEPAVDGAGRSLRADDRTSETEDGGLRGHPDGVVPVLAVCSQCRDSVRRGAACGRCESEDENEVSHHGSPPGDTASVH